MTIVTSHYRYKRPPRKRAKAATIEGPAIVRVASKRDKALTRVNAADEPKPTPAPANDDRKSAIVTIKRKTRRFADVPEMTPEEYKRRGDLAAAMFQEMKRQIAEKQRKP